MNENLIKAELHEGEKLLWHGMPANRFFTKAELLRVPFSAVLIAAFIIYWSTRKEVNAIMYVIIILTLLYVVYTTFATLFIKNSRRKRTLYAITDTRLLFILADKNDNLLKKSEFDIAKLSNSAIDINKDGTGSLLFSDNKTVDMYPLKSGNNWANRPGGAFTSRVFFDIDAPEDVLKIYKEIHSECHRNDAVSSEDKMFSKYDE